MCIKNVWDAISRSNSVCPKNILFLTDNNVSLILGSLRCGGDEKVIIISNSLTRQNKNFARASRFFVHFFAVNCTISRENA